MVGVQGARVVGGRLPLAAHHPASTVFRRKGSREEIIRAAEEPVQIVNVESFVVYERIIIVIRVIHVNFRDKSPVKSEFRALNCSAAGDFQTAELVLLLSHKSSSECEYSLFCFSRAA